MLQILFHRFLFSLHFVYTQHIQDTLSFSFSCSGLSSFFFFLNPGGLCLHKECGRDSAVYIFSSQMSSQSPNSIHWSESCSYCSETRLAQTIPHNVLGSISLLFFFCCCFFCLFVWSCHVACGDLSSPSRMGPVSPAVGAWRFNYYRLPAKSYFCTILFPLLYSSPAPKVCISAVPVGTSCGW